MDECSKVCDECGAGEAEKHSSDCSMYEGFRWLDEHRERRGMQIGPMPSRPMDDDKVHTLTRDVAFNRHSMNDGHHVSPSDNAKVQVGTDGIEVVLAQGIDEEMLKKTLTAATRATIGLDLHQALPGDWEHCQAFCDNTKKFQEFYSKDKYTPMPRLECDKHSEHEHRADAGPGEVVWAGRVPYPDWEEMLKGGLQTALETQVIVFAVSGVSRTATHQLVRSRRAAFHQQSQRASYMGDAPEFRMPESVWINKRARMATLHLIMESWRTYQVLCEEDISYQDARFTLLEGTTNFIMLEYPIREFLNVFAYRGCSMFQWEIVDVMRKCRDALVEAHPFMEPYVKISCEKTGPASWPVMKPSPDGKSLPILAGREDVEHHCTFQGWESPEGQCDFPWAKDEARTFKPEFHRISKKGGATP